jgi:hypothetical protein
MTSVDREMVLLCIKHKTLAVLASPCHKSRPAARISHNHDHSCELCW